MAEMSPSPEKIWYLKKIELFNNLSRQEMVHLAQRTAEKNYRKKEVIYFPGKPGQQIYLLKKGIVKISRLMADGRELTLALLKPGEIFGELEALPESEANDQAEACSDAMICVLNREDLMDMIRMKPELGIRLSKIMSFRRRVIENKLENLLFRNIPQRLAALFLELKNTFGETQNGIIKIRVPLTHEDIANLIGAARATVTSEISTLKKKGLIDSQGKYFYIKDAENLGKTLL